MTDTTAVPRLLWGIDSDDSPLLGEQARILAIWLTNSGDPSWIKGYGAAQSPVMLNYARGGATELIVWLAGDVEYALSQQLITDLVMLVKALVGGPIYIALFCEFETYANVTGQQISKLVEPIAKAVHAANADAKVGLCFGGYDWGGTPDRPMGDYTAGIAASDFLAVQEMQSCTSNNVKGQNILIPQIQSSVAQLGTFGKPVMIAYYEAWGATQACQDAAFKQVRDALFLDAPMKALTGSGRLFAWTFKNDLYVSGAQMKDAGPRLTRYEASCLLGHHPTAGLP